jgi:hypothetical protein
MKKISVLIILLAFAGYAQVAPQKSVIELKSEIKGVQTNNEYPVLINSEALPGKKSIGLAILYSLILPGMGELYAENYYTGKYFTIAEAALWCSYIGVDAYGNWQKDNYKKYAVTNGGVTTAGKDDDFYATIGNYKDIGQYNDDKSFNREFNAMYNETTHYFKWSSTEDRKTYRNMWVSSENAYNNLRFIVGGFIVNRIVSAVNAWRAASSYNKRLKENQFSIYVGVGDGLYSPFDGFNLNISAAF